VRRDDGDAFGPNLWRHFVHLGVNFINILRARFSYEHLFSSYDLALNELLYEKFARLKLMKLTAGVNFINILRARFSYESAFLPEM